MKKKVLILDAQAVQTLVIARFLKRSGYDVILFCDNKLNYGYYTRYADERFIAPSSKDEDAYVKYLIGYLKERKIDTMIPMTDDAAVIMSKYKSSLIKYTSYIMPEYDVFQKGYDKNKLMALCAKNGYPHPKTIDLDIVDILDVEDEFFPALIKPNYTAGGRGMTLVHNVEEVKQHYPIIHEQYGSCHLQQFIPAGGRQIKVQIFIDRRDGNYYASVIHKQRYYPENGGSSCCNVTINDDALVAICKHILDDINWNGFADFDLIEDPRDNVVKVMEINPRIPACIKSAILSGMDYATMIADVSLGNPLKTYSYEPGQKLRHIGFEVLWFLYSKNRFTTSPCWFNFFGRKLSFQDFSWRDPMPFFVGTYANIKRQLDPDFRMSKSGLR